MRCVKLIEYCGILALLAATLPACGHINTGGTVAPNDPAPVGDIVAQGEFTALNGKTVSGVAVIYKLTETGSHVVRLQGITAPDESGLQVWAKADDVTVMKSALRANKGTQNYSTSITGSPKWNSVTIRSTVNTQTPDYGTALLK